MAAEAPYSFLPLAYVHAMWTDAIILQTVP